ncbi:MAG TPA: class I SAM-dependent methyltransferase [Acidimicrobiales bacterium]|nr:class I SAM-dependent methyltransferase [Acidimicrobiales bacterium]
MTAGADRHDDSRELWDSLADWWQATFTGGADPEYERQIIPLVTGQLGGARRVLDLGCGEGQVTRALLERAGVAVVAGLDPSAAQLGHASAAEAARAGGGAPASPPQYLRGCGEAMPFADASFDGVVCCLAIEHTADPDAVLAEVARVLEPGGRFLLLVNHPMFQGTGSGFIDDRILGERYWRVGPYLVEDVTWEHVDSGIELPFAHRPLSRYLNPLADAGVLLVHMDEPAPHPEFLASSLDPELEAAIPRLLSLCFERRGRRGRGGDEACRGAGRDGADAAVAEDGAPDTGQLDTIPRAGVP